MDFQDAIQKIEERGDFNRFAEVKPVFEDKLASLRPGDHTERGICYYYLLVSYLKANLVHETEESIEFYEKMDSAFEAQLNVYKTKRDHFSWPEIKDFFRLMDRCYESLETLYLKHNFRKRRLAAYRRKMEFAKDSFLFDRDYNKWFEYKFLETTSYYGTSLVRWAFTTLLFILIMGGAYALLDQFLAEEMRTLTADAHWFDYLYFSMITLTTVGFGDITPMALSAKMLVMAQAFFGFIMLGIFIGLINKRI